MATDDANHYDAMHARHGEGLTPAQHGIVYSKAYEQGHASGLEEVGEYYRDLADMARELLATAAPAPTK